MAENITIFRNADDRYYTIVIDGRVVDSLGKDEALMTVACALIGSEPPPYAVGKSMQEIRDQERERAARPPKFAPPPAPGGHFGGLPWEPWTGANESPVPAGTLVHVRLRGGGEYMDGGRADTWVWRWGAVESPGDIIAWRRA